MYSPRRFPVSLVALALIAGGMLVILPASGADDGARDPLARVLEGWRARGRKYCSARAAWVTKNSEAKLNYATTDEEDLDVALSPEEMKELAKQRGEYTLESRLSMDGIKMRFDWKGERLVGRDKPMRIDTTKTYDGKSSRSLHPRSNGRNFDTITIHKFEHPRANYLPEGRPLRWAFGAGDEQAAGIHFTRLSVLQANTVVRGVRCIVVRESDPKSPLTHDYWVAPSRDFAVLRYVVTAGKQVHLRLDTEFAEQPTGFWTPRKWTTSYFAQDGSVRLHQDSHVTMLEMNPAIPQSEFQLAIDIPGTFVQDDSGNGRDKSYFVP